MKKKNQNGIILIITSFNQLYNFLSFFEKKKLFHNKKIYLTIFSDQIPNFLIFKITKYIKKFCNVEILDLRRNSIKSQNNNFKTARYYFTVFQKIYLLRNSLTISSIVISGQMQLSILFFIILFSSSNFFFIEDGVGEYVPYAKFEKKHIHFSIVKFMLLLNRPRIFILSLSNSIKNYHRILNQPFLIKRNFIDNRARYKKFLKSNFKKKNSSNLKCILISTNISRENFKYYKNLYVKTLIQINKNFSYKPSQIFFFFHPRIKLTYKKKLTKILSKYSKLKSISSNIVECHLLETNLEIVIGSLSSALFYAKTIFNIKKVYYLSNYNLTNHNHFSKIFKFVGIKNFYDIYKK
jgi:hypothetical protein